MEDIITPQSAAAPASASARYSHNYQEESDRCYAAWKDKLVGLPDEQARVVAVLLENQRLMNELRNKPDPEQDQQLLELTRKVWSNFLGFELVRIHPLIGPTAHIIMGETEHHIAAKTRFMKNRCKADQPLSSMADTFRLDLFQEIVRDLRNNAGTLAEWDASTALAESDSERYESLYVKLVEISSILSVKTRRMSKPIWLVVGAGMANLICRRNHLPEQEWNRPGRVMFLNRKWNVIVNPDQPANEVLLGAYEPGETGDGYLYAPYVPFTTVGGPEGTNETGFLTRYDKKLTSSKPYARLTIKGWPELEVRDVTPSADR
jgi:hypothetical protein